VPSVQSASPSHCQRDGMHLPPVWHLNSVSVHSFESAWTKKNTQDATPTAISNHTQLTNQTQQQIMLIYPPRGRACRQLAWHPYWTTSHDTPALVRFLELAGGFLGSFSLLRSRVYLEERFSLPSFEQRCHSPTPSQKINYFLWANEMIEMFHPLPNKL